MGIGIVTVFVGTASVITSAMRPLSPLEQTLKVKGLPGSGGRRRQPR